jgi:hypothetical protein
MNEIDHFKFLVLCSGDVVDNPTRCCEISKCLISIYASGS